MTCSEADCGRPTLARGLCSMHYQRARKVTPRVRPDAVPCPSIQAYKRGCRCDGCRTANRESARERTGAKPFKPSSKAPHGANRYTRAGCRCDICRDGNAARMRDYFLRNPDAKRRANAAVYAARAGTPYTDEAREYIKVIAGDPCVYCLDSSESIDHIVPISAGGSGDWWNLAPACISCNASKNDRPLLQHLLRMSTIHTRGVLT